MALKDNPHITKIWTALELRDAEKRHWEMVTHIQTTLHLDMLHPNYDAAAVEALTNQIETYLRDMDSCERVSVIGIS